MGVHACFASVPRAIAGLPNLYKTVNRQEILLASILIAVFASGAIACLLYDLPILVGRGIENHEHYEHC